MSSKKRTSGKGRIVVEGVRRPEPDISKLARVLVALAMAEAETASGRKTTVKPRDGRDEEGALSA
ncbi:MAG: hypothetical protein VB036_05240 [Propionicimonas sp.]|nr:hypothetical protein [Propionicimonas sp.]